MTTKLLPAFLAVALIGASAEAQQAAHNSEKVRAAGIPLKVEFVLSRYQGEKKLSSMPYILSLTSNEDSPTELRTGLMVPVVTQIQEQPSISYKDVGTTLHCSAESLPGGLFRLVFGVEQNGVHGNDAQKAGAWTVGGGALSSAPIIRLFKTTTRMLLRDGQTGRFVTATDPVSGEVVTMDVTLSLVK
jgi:hypothetical protein